jgi:hypothetical protein
MNYKAPLIKQNMSLNITNKYPSNTSFEYICYREPKDSNIFRLLIKPLLVCARLYKKVYCTTVQVMLTL